MSGVAFTPIRQARASGEIVSQIERAIFDGELQTGDRLESERELAERFGVSRITVRDALRVLEARGLVHVKVGASGGAFVSDTNVDQVAESISTMIQLRRMTLSGVAEARTVVETATSSCRRSTTCATCGPRRRPRRRTRRSSTPSSRTSRRPRAS
ncbi:MAG: FadR family transcriptional regulator [Chloroflexi bacterium]|nr:MAG: FadR family transcriptional regulator [Chloroflexota bacterium]